MTKFSFTAAFAIGLAVVGWIGFGFLGAGWIPAVVTVVIAGVYLLGAYELRQFRASSQALEGALRALAQPPARLADWLATVPANLRDAVRLRIAGERGVLPGPALTPYLVGLLVMLGMLGTFLGMVLTFRGAVFALEGSTDLGAIRGALAAPIRGLGLSFGTSVAGVATSAMLGLMAAIARRERLQVARELDARIAGVLAPFSALHQRHETFQALQAQSRTLPQVAEGLAALMERIEQRSAQLDTQLLERQAQFQREATLAYTTLAERVGTSLRESLAASAQAASENLRPVVAGAMEQVVQDAQRMHERVGQLAQQQVDALSTQFGATLQGVGGQLQSQWGQALAQVEALLAQLQEQARTRSDSEARWAEQHGRRLDQLAGAWKGELAALREDEAQRATAAVQRLGDLQAAVAQHLAQLGAALEAPLTRLLHTASEVPQAAAGVIADLRQEMSRLAERDNAALAERNELLGQLRASLQALQQASDTQRTATEALVGSASTVMGQAGARFEQLLESHAARAGEAAVQVAAGASEVANLANAFQQSVQQFQAGNDKLVEGLQKVEAALQRSTERSDEQLAYYVEQAREVIDLSITSQQGVLEQLRELQSRSLALAEEARA